MQTPAPQIPYSTQTQYLPLKRNRIWELDFIRGICVILMILDHLSILIASYFGKSWYGYGLEGADSFTLFCDSWCNSPARPAIHNVVLFFFFGVSGISCTLSRSNLKRGSMLAIVAMLYSFCSLFAEEVMGIPGVITVFGVLDFLAVCMLLYALIEWACKRDPFQIAIVAVGIMGIALILYFCYTPPADTPLFFATIFPPEDFYGNPSLFYKQSEISPGDLFPMIPYCVYFFAGVVLAPLLYGERRSLLKKLDGKWNKPVSFVGRHALIVYIVHLVAMAGLLALISGLFITPGDFGI